SSGQRNRIQYSGTHSASIRVRPTGGCAPRRARFPDGARTSMSLTTADPATILVRGGQVVDGTGAPRPADVVVAGTRISAVIDRDGADGPSVAPPEPGGTASVVDARGCLVLPGLIDLHTHVFAPGTGLGGAPDTVGVDQAVTTVVDAGSTGARDFARFREDVVAPARTRVLSWLNIAEPGLVDGLSELADL